MRKVTFALQMRTRRAISALVVAAGLLGAACGGGPSNVASHSPTPAAGSPSAQASPAAGASPSAPAQPSPTSLPALNGSFGVLVSPITGSGSYSVAIVGVDGKVVASAQAGSPAAVSCNNTAAAVVPLPVSTSDHRLYFMDAAGSIRYLGPNGDTGTATSIPAGTGSRRSMFAVSPDDTRIAVVVDDFVQGGANTRLYVENLSGGGNHIDLFSQSGAYTLWPIGWHGTNNLVVAKVPSCTQGGGPFCCGPLELHVTDPATATRRFTLGNASSCVIAGSPSPAGVVCENTPSFTQGTWLNWTAGTVRSLALNGPAFAYVSPGGSFVAMVDNSGTSFTIGAATIAGVFACAWIDDRHILSGGDTQHQPRVADVINGTVVPVAAQGDCGGRLPGGL